MIRSWPFVILPGFELMHRHSGPVCLEQKCCRWCVYSITAPFSLEEVTIDNVDESAGENPFVSSLLAACCSACSARCAHVQVLFTLLLLLCMHNCRAAGLTSARRTPGMDAAKILEGDLRQLSVEAKGFSAVKDAAERGIMKLKAVQDQFHTPDVPKPRCAEFIRPFLLACNHTEAGKRLLGVAIAAMQRLIMMDVVERSEPPNILRVLLIQARDGGVVRLAAWFDPSAPPKP